MTTRAARSSGRAAHCDKATGSRSRRRLDSFRRGGPSAARSASISSCRRTRTPARACSPARTRRDRAPRPQQPLRGCGVAVPIPASAHRAARFPRRAAARHASMVRGWRQRPMRTHSECPLRERSARAWPTASRWSPPAAATAPVPLSSTRSNTIASLPASPLSAVSMTMGSSAWRSSSDASAGSRGAGRQRAERRRQLLPHCPIRIVGALDYSGPDRMVGLTEPALGDTHCRRPHVARRIVQRLCHQRRLDAVQAVESPKRVKARAPVLRASGERSGAAPRLLDPHVGRAAAAPYRATSRSDAKASRPAARSMAVDETRPGIPPRRLVHDAIDATEADGLFELRARI